MKNPGLHIRLIALSSLLLLGGCSIRQKLVVTTVEPLIEIAMESVLAETDLPLAKTAMESDLKLLDAMIRTSPRNMHLKSLACEGYTGYTMLFVEDDSPERARKLYLRARDYGLKGLSSADPRVGVSGSFSQFSDGVNEIPAGMIQTVYWTAVAWGNWANLSRSDPLASAQFVRVKTLMDWVAAHDSTYFHAGPVWFFGVYYATLPPILGGNVELSRKCFEKAADMTDGKFLCGKLLYARTYAVQTLDRSLFDRLIGDIQKGVPESREDLNLLNHVAQLKAEQLDKRADELF